MENLGGAVVGHVVAAGRARQCFGYHGGEAWRLSRALFAADYRQADFDEVAVAFFGMAVHRKDF